MKVEGYGLRVSEDLPIVIQVADRAERIDDILPPLDAMVTEGSPSRRRS
jgi:PII-like signaling protein